MLCYKMINILRQKYISNKTYNVKNMLNYIKISVRSVLRTVSFCEKTWIKL